MQQKPIRLVVVALFAISVRFLHSQ